jgi:hypothetical protein
MEMNENGIDRLYRQAASKFRKPLSEAEKAGLWTSVNQRRRRPVFWYWVSAGTAGMILGAFVFFSGGESIQTTDEMAEMESGQVVNAVEYSSGGEAIGEAREGKISEAISQTSLSAEESPVTSSEYTSPAVSSEVAPADLPQNGAGANVHFSESEQRNEGMVEGPEPGPESFISPIEPGISFPEDPSLSELREWITDEDMGVSERVGRTPGVVAGLRSFPLKNLDYREAVLDYHFPLKFGSDRGQSDEGSAGKWLVDLFVQTEVMSTDILASSGSAEYAANIERTVRPWLSMSAAVSIGRRLTGNLNVLTGIEYQRFTEKFDFRQESTHYKMEYHDWAYFLDDGSGAPIWVDGAVLTAVSSETKLVAPNHHEFLKIPVLVEYLFPVGSWELGVSSGLAVNIVQNHSGYMVDEDGGYRSLVSGDYSRRLLSDVRFGIYAGYPIGENWSMYARTGMQIYPGNWLEVRSGELEKSVTAITIGMGIRREF